MTGDLRLAFRTLVRQPGFSAVVIATLGLGIGAVTVMFAALWGVVLRPLPFPEPDRLVWVEAVTDTGNPNSLWNMPMSSRYMLMSGCMCDHG